MKENSELHVYVSGCCKASTQKIGEVVVKTSPGCTSYFHEQCLECKKPCHTRAHRIFDSDGVEIKSGDLVECPNEPEDHACRWHIAYMDGDWLDIRDLGHNNCHMYSICGPYYNRGHYSQYPGKLDADDLEYYFDIPKQEPESE